MGVDLKKSMIQIQSYSTNKQCFFTKIHEILQLIFFRKSNILEYDVLFARFLSKL